MYTIRFVRDDSLQYIETTSKEKANQEYLELASDPYVNELVPLVLTIDVKFSTNGRTFTYFLDLTIEEVRKISEAKQRGFYKTIKTAWGETAYVVSIIHRSTEELKVIAKRDGFKFSEYKVLHGTFIKGGKKCST